MNHITESRDMALALDVVGRIANRDLGQFMLPDTPINAIITGIAACD